MNWRVELEESMERIREQENAAESIAQEIRGAVDCVESYLDAKEIADYLTLHYTLTPK